jgi:hypothetical protein
MRNLKSFVYLLIIGSVTSCIEEVKLPIRNETARLVVEGMITNEPLPYAVKLTYSGAFQTTRELPPELYVSNATVTISDDLGKTVSLFPLGQGIYQTTDSSYVGTVGRSYTLTVETSEGKKYVSQPEKLLPVAPIDSLTFEFYNNDVTTEGKYNGYKVYVNTRDPAETGNYYRWTGYGYSRVHSTGVPCSLGSPNICNDYCWQPNFSTEVHILSDAAINGRPIRNQYAFFSPIYTTGPHLVEVSQLSMTREAYQFWRLYQEQQTRVGSILDPLPAPIIGNVANANDSQELALGYFAASAVARKRFTLRDFDPKHINKIIVTTEYLIRQGDCQYAFPGTTLFSAPPPGW